MSNSWIILDCRIKGLERLSITDEKGIICRIENTESGRPIDEEDLANAKLIASAPELKLRIHLLEAALKKCAKDEWNRGVYGTARETIGDTWENS